MNTHVAPSAALAHSGVWGTSSPSAFTPYAIFCVGNDKVREAAFRAWALDKGVPFKSLHGCYKGIQEASFIIPQEYLDYCTQWWINEESILLLSSQYRSRRMYGTRIAVLYFPKYGLTQPIGEWQRQPKEYALKQEAWTYDPSQDEYYVCEHTTQL